MGQALVAKWSDFSPQTTFNYLRPGKGGDTQFLFRLGVHVPLCIYAEILPLEFSSAISMTCLLPLMQAAVCTILTIGKYLRYAYDYARAKPPPAPWIYGRPYQFRGRTYLYERPRKQEFFRPHSRSTLQDLLIAKHHRRMKQLLRGKGLLRDTYRSRNKRRRKRSHRARPRLFPGKVRGRKARYDKSVRLTHLIIPWKDYHKHKPAPIRLRKRFSNLLNALFHRQASSRAKKKVLSKTRLPRYGIFAAWTQPPDQEDELKVMQSAENPDNPSDSLFVLSAPNGLLQPLRQTSKNSSVKGSVEEFPVIWDTGASRSVSPNKEDFKGAIRPSLTKSLTGLANGLDVCGEGEVKWTVMADNGLPFTMEHTAYYVPGSPCRLMSCQTFSEYTYSLYGHAYEFVMRSYDPRTSR